MSKKIKDIVSWLMLDESVIKLEKEDKVFDVDSKAVEFMKKKELSEDGGFEVEVEIDESKGENGTIVRLTSGKDETSKKEAPEEVKKEKSNEETVTKELTVAGVSTKNRAVVFKEEENVWYDLPEEIDVQKFKDECTKQRVSVLVVKKDNGNDVIRSVTALTELPRPDKPTPTPPKTSNSYETNTQKSIEAQVAVEHSHILAGTLAKAGLLCLQDVNSFVDTRARKNYALMQEVKKSG